MSTWAVVYHLRQAEGREQRIARRYIVNVPEDATKSDVQFALDAAGFAPVEFGIEWANHSAIRREEGQEIEERGEVETGTWAELVKAGSTDRRVTLRMSPSLHRRVTAAAAAAGESINTWCVEALEYLLNETSMGDRGGRSTGPAYTERAKRVLAMARDEARRLRHNYLGTEHLLLGLIRVEDGIAGRVLIHLGITLEKARKALESIIGAGDTEPTGEVGLTPRAKKVIELARDSARKMNNHYIGTEHLLLGIIREGEGIAAGMIEALGVSKEQVRLSVMQIIVQSNVKAGAGTPAPTEPPAQEEPAAPEEQPGAQESAEGLGDSQ